MASIPPSQELIRPTPAPISANGAIQSLISGPGPATGGRFYKADKQRPSILFGFCQDSSKFYATKRQQWVAIMEVKCFDVPRLMREGFYWDASNVIKEEGYIEYGKAEPNADAGACALKRWYFLADTNQPRRWIASIAVTSLDIEILSNFDLGQLSRDNVRVAVAWNQNGEVIYGYQAHTPPDQLSSTTEAPMRCFNMIYDTMPMEGLWPWPRKENEDDAKGRIDQGAAREIASGSSQSPGLRDISSLIRGEYSRR
ncbi:hypothetical protein SAMD00023353_3101400 [Rosellinia necatrix]|uniref:Uncharacterized protein n=1 Tax=Rosellinia necatrix TaxID=77044 RepID=A0A1W2TSL8_ROSNE|nr:hypothetical protein SAMD00023353_3101400 [Rosellinia necatrix]